jgi:zona occludens toxin
MINLITGLPGAAKTLYTLTIVDAVSKADNRPVFYSGISGVTLPGWTEIQAEDWYTCPPNSLILIDECQRIFRPRTISKDVPKYVSELETHRHNGLDLYMITQHPMLADSALRRLSGRHLHVVRKFGLQSSTIHEWPGVKETCDKQSSRVDSIKHLWKFNTAMFGSYKSAEIHTVKRAFPMRLKLLLLAPFVLGTFIYFGYQSYDSKVHPVKSQTAATTGKVFPPASAPAPAALKTTYQDALQDAKEYAYVHTPRVQDVASTAPRYDEITKPITAPVPAMCVLMADRCQCYTQQGTKLSIALPTCKNIVANGYFQDFNPTPSAPVSSSAYVLTKTPGPSS